MDDRIDTKTDWLQRAGLVDTDAEAKNDRRLTTQEYADLLSLKSRQAFDDIRLAHIKLGCGFTYPPKKGLA